MDYPIVNVVVQSDAEENIPIDFWIIQEAAQAAIQTEPMETWYNKS